MCPWSSPPQSNSPTSMVQHFLDAGDSHFCIFTPAILLSRISTSPFYPNPSYNTCSQHSDMLSSSSNPVFPPSRFQYHQPSSHQSQKAGIISDSPTPYCQVLSALWLKYLLDLSTFAHPHCHSRTLVILSLSLCFFSKCKMALLLLIIKPSRDLALPADKTNP